MIEISSKLRANTALMKPSNEKMVAVSNTTRMVTPRWCTCRSVKNSDSRVTITPTASPRNTPPRV
ncbi:hypothetical protein D3C71_2150370 [compost metagenome]